MTVRISFPKHCQVPVRPESVQEVGNIILRERQALLIARWPGLKEYYQALHR